MDGFSGAEGVVVLASTNRPDVLDPALLRPGRFDRTIMVHPPDQKGREAILAVHTKRVPLATDVDLSDIARATPGMTGAELANLVNEAALGAAGRGSTAVTQMDLTNALEKIRLVRRAMSSCRPRNGSVPPTTRAVMRCSASSSQEQTRSARSRSFRAGARSAPRCPHLSRTGTATTSATCAGASSGALGGMAAEEEVFGVTTTGAESDLENATRIARSMVGRWGMSDRIGPVSVLPPEGDPRMQGASDGLLGAVDDEVRRVIDESYQEARRLLRENRGRLDRLAERLLAQETLNQEEIYSVVRGDES
jgi:cell division protease FtsH